jgi:surfactin synthase thioesterase subunit/glycosyltransferase involved in cell wall biosynthesis
MRILLAQNSQYFPAHGGGDKSNRLLIEALAARGHECRVVARIPVFGETEERRYLEERASRCIQPVTQSGVTSFERNGVTAHVVTNSNLRACFSGQIEAFRPDAILASTDDPAQLLLDVALKDGTARVVYLVRATLAVPFGPDCAFPSAAKTERIRACDAVVGVSEYVARYIREHSGIPAVHVPISLMEAGDWPPLGRFSNEFVLLANPCAVKGISIFLALADAFPSVAFAAVPTWGTNEEDRAALRARPNVTLLDPVDDMNLLFSRTRILLVPSLWAEARSRIVVEAMLRGIPVMAADVGGIPEAKMGVPYLLPVNPIVHYETRLDEQMVPIAKVPPQDITPWSKALGRLLDDRGHYEEISRRSREAAIDYAENLTAEPFESLLAGGRRAHPRPASPKPAALDTLSPERRKLLALRLRKQAPATAWFAGLDGSRPALFWFPHAGGGTAARQVDDLRYAVVQIRLPGRESRLAEAPFTRMAPLVEALGAAIQPHLDRPFAFFGHSMGAIVAFELTRLLRRRGLPLPRILIASAARAPQFRRNHVPPPDPPDDQLLADLRRLEGISPELLEDPSVATAILPALRADTALYRNYVYTEDDPLDCPIRAYGGTEDPNIEPHHLERWREQTRSSFAVRRFPGGHFYLRSSREEFRAALEEDLA